MKQSTDTCASCASFPLDESIVAEGRAACAIRQEPRQWDWLGCVLHNPAPDRRARVTLVKQLIAAQQPKREEDGQADA